MAQSRHFTTTQIEQRGLASIFTTLNVVPNAFITKLQEVNIAIRTAPPDHQEVRKVLTHLKNRKAANDIPAAYLKYAAQSEELIDEIVRLYSIVWNTHQIPKSHDSLN